MKYYTFIIVILFYLLSIKSYGATYYVNDAVHTNDRWCSIAGNDLTGDGTSLKPFATLAKAFTAATLSGDSIKVDDGSYSEKDLSSPPNGIVIYGAGTTRTTFTNPGSDNYFIRIDDNNTVLANMKLKNYDDNGGGFGQVIGVSTNVTGVQIIAVQIDHAQQTGSASVRPIYIASGASAFISGGGTTCNSYDGGGGIYITGATTTCTITNYSIVGNYRLTDIGVGIYIANGNVIIKNTIFQDNSTDGTSTGSALYVGAGNVTIQDCFFNLNKTINNSGGNNVGGTILIGGGNVRITRSKLWGHLQGGSSTSYGAAIGINAGSLTLDSCWFSSNSGSTARGTDVYNKGGTVNARNCIFGSSSNQIGVASGVANSFSISTCGSPGIYTGSGSVLQINNASPTYSANPVVPIFTGTCSSSFTILPIELTNFNIDCYNGNTILSWQTASEKNNQLFYIERSADGINFITIGNTKGAGNSESYHNYTFIDKEKSDVVSYYRLTQLDYDGRKSQSMIISLENICGENTDTGISIFPNPTQNNTSINLILVKHSSVHIEIYNNVGQMIKLAVDQSYEAETESVNIDTSQLAPGVYFLKTIINQTEYIQKLIKL
ncbi:MAG: T9SS type A sorting domain-containing protein [Bacteroidetes bacterium]|nr:T9SS type A sorting domain-containing protein [Bacteroidota bacterium]